MAKLKKETCPVCRDRGFIEYEHGIFRKVCPKRCPAALTRIAEMRPPSEPVISSATGRTEETGGGNEDSQCEGNADTGQPSEREEPEAAEEDGDTAQ